MPAATLRELQLRLSELVLSPESGGLGELGREIGVSAKPPIPVASRVEIYRRAYWIRMRESLEEDFPEVRELLGKDGFDRACRAYLETRPSRYASLAEASEGFPAFLAESALEPSLPFLSELARLEWEQTLSALAAEPEPCDFSALAALGPEEQARARLKLAPSVRFFESAWVVHREPGSRSRERRQARAVLSCRGDEVSMTEVTPDQWRLLERIAAGQPIGSLAAGLSGAGAGQLMEWFSAWVTRGWIAGFERGEA